MLETIKDYIKYLPDIPFDLVYSEYILSVQDSNIDAEMSFLLKHNKLDLRLMDNTIHQSFERLNQI